MAEECAALTSTTQLAGTEVTIDEVRNQSFIMECTSCQCPVTLIDVRGKKFQT